MDKVLGAGIHRKPILVCGLDQLTREGSIDGLNARITRFTDRIKATRKEDGLYVEYKGSTEEEHRVSMEQQVLCKFILNVEGNSAAYRFGPLLGLGFCISERGLTLYVYGLNP